MRSEPFDRGMGLNLRVATRLPVLPDDSALTAHRPGLMADFHETGGILAGAGKPAATPIGSLCDVERRRPEDKEGEWANCLAFWIRSDWQRIVAAGVAGKEIPRLPYLSNGMVIVGGGPACGTFGTTNKGDGYSCTSLSTGSRCLVLRSIARTMVRSSTPSAEAATAGMICRLSGRLKRIVKVPSGRSLIGSP